MHFFHRYPYDSNPRGKREWQLSRLGGIDAIRKLGIDSEVSRKRLLMHATESTKRVKGRNITARIYEHA